MSLCVCVCVRERERETGGGGGGGGGGWEREREREKERGEHVCVSEVNRYNLCITNFSIYMIRVCVLCVASM